MNERVVVVTGGLGVLGSAVASVAASRGMTVAIIDSAMAANATTARLQLCGVDLTNPASAGETIDAIVSRLGRIDVLLNIAGAFRWTKLEDSSADDWDRLFRVNVQTAANSARAALPALRASGAGRIVNVGAAAAERASAGMGPYTAAKSGVHKLTESLADELKTEQVTVNAVLPSIIDTPQNRADMPDADFSRWVQPLELADVILFLASDQARAVTGALIRVTGQV